MEPVYGETQCVDAYDLDHIDRKFSWKKLWAFTGPGFLMSIAYLDPGNIESDLQVGAETKYSLLWLLFWATMMGLVLQLCSSRLGFVTGKDLAQHCRLAYPSWSRYTLWIMAEIALVGSDIQEVLGSAIAINILSNEKIPLYAGALITNMDCFGFLFLENFGIRKLESFFGLLVGTMAISFGYLYVTTHPQQVSVTEHTVVPELTDHNFQYGVGMIGAVIMPHNMYLYSSLVQSRKIDRHNKDAVRDANFYTTIEATTSLVGSFVINLFVLATFAHSFAEGSYHGDNDDCQYDKIALQSAGTCLGEVHGKAMKYIWGIGLLAAGNSSTMTGTYAGQFVAGGFLDMKIKPWQRIMFTRSLAIVPTLACTVSIKAKDLDTVNSSLNILQSIQLPFALIPVIYFSAQESVMGEEFKNGRRYQWFLNCLAAIVIGVNMYLTITLVDFTVAWQAFLFTVATLLYLSFCAYLLLGPQYCTAAWNKVRGIKPEDDESPQYKMLTS